MSPTQRTIQVIKESHWLDDFSIDSFRFNTHTPTHEVFEKVLVNISASYGFTWKDVYNANAHSAEKYAARVISYILIFRVLYRINRIKTKEAMKKLLGEYNYNLVLKFNEDIA